MYCDNILIVNVPPDLTGKIRTHERNRVLELADRLGIRGGKKKLPNSPVNLTFKQTITASSEQKEHPATLANDYSLESFWTAADSTAELEIGFDKAVYF